MTYTYWRRLALDPVRVRSLHRVNEDTAATDTLIDGAWVTVPGDSLAHRDQDHVIEQLSTDEAAELPP